jgi:hypothetical protein
MFNSFSLYFYYFIYSFLLDQVYLNGNQAFPENCLLVNYICFFIFNLLMHFILGVMVETSQDGSVYTLLASEFNHFRQIY